MTSTSELLHITPEELSALRRIDYEEAELSSYRAYRNVVVLRSGICLKNGLILKESIYRFPRRYPRFMAIAYGSLLTRRLARADPAKTYLVIHNLWSGGYYHWITESLARLLPVRHLLGDATVLLPSNTGLGEVMVRSLECFGVKDIEFFPAHRNLVVPNLVLPDHPPEHRLVSRASVEFIRAHVLRSVGDGSPEAPTPSRVFISRARSRRRKIANEDEVAAFLAARGFERVFMEELGFVDQVRIMQAADIVVSQHGAGLTNLIFMRAGAKVLELFRRPLPQDRASRDVRRRRLNPAYPRLAARAGVHYYCMLCQAADPSQRHGFGDIVVDLPSLQAKLDAVERGA